jgi:phosphatidylglycerophosphatase A
VRVFHQPDYRGDYKPVKQDPAVSRPNAGLIVWLAQGFGVGRIPVAPGTFGSVVGLLWFLLLLAGGSLPVFAAGVMLGVPLSVWVCGEAEKILQQKDPGSIVMDEIIAIPICFLGWVLALYAASGKLPTPAYFLSSTVWPWTLAVFVAFRFFDVLKPWPVKQSQALPGGWGVTVDDVLAAGYVNLVVLAAKMASNQ